MTQRLMKSASPVRPTEPNSQWMVTQGPGHASLMTKMAGSSSYIARKGVSTSANAVYWVELIEKVSEKKVLVRNYTKGAKKKVDPYTFAVEDGLLYPMLRGKDCRKWVYFHKFFILFPHEPGSGIHAIPETRLQTIYPLTYAHFKKFEKILASRKEYLKFLKPQGDPFFSLYPVREYTFASHKVAFREICTRIEAVVISDAVDTCGQKKMVVPDHKLVIVPFDDIDAAHYLCALMNSSLFNAFATSYCIGTQLSTHLFQNVGVPKYDPLASDHRKLSNLSMRCHEDAAGGQMEHLRVLEEEIDHVAARLWGIADGELMLITNPCT